VFNLTLEDVISNSLVVIEPVESPLVQQPHKTRRAIYLDKLTVL